MVLGSLGRWWLLMLDCKAFLASAQAVWVVLESLGGWWVVMLVHRPVLA